MSRLSFHAFSSRIRSSCYFQATASGRSARAGPTLSRPRSSSTPAAWAPIWPRSSPTNGGTWPSTRRRAGSRWRRTRRRQGIIGMNFAWHDELIFLLQGEVKVKSDRRPSKKKLREEKRKMKKGLYAKVNGRRQKIREWVIFSWRCFLSSS